MRQPPRRSAVPVQVYTDDPLVARMASGAHIDVWDLGAGDFSERVIDEETETEMGAFRLFGDGVIDGEHVWLFSASPEEKVDAGCIVLSLERVTGVSVLYDRAE